MPREKKQVDSSEGQTDGFFDESKVWVRALAFFLILLVFVVLAWYVIFLFS